MLMIFFNCLQFQGSTQIRIQFDNFEFESRDPDPVKFIDWRYSQSCWYFRPLF